MSLRKRAGIGNFLTAPMATLCISIGAAAITGVVVGARADEDPGSGNVSTIVQVVRPSLESGAGTVNLPGSFEPYERALLYARVSGYLSRMKVDIGDRVKRNDTIAELQIPEMEAEQGRAKADVASATAALRRAEANAKLAEITYGRLSDLQTREPQAVTQQDVDAAAAELAVARSNVDSAAAAIEVAGAKLVYLQALMSFAVIRAPFDGVVVRRFVDPGALVVAGSDDGEPVVELASVDRLRLVLAIPESFVPRVREGLGAEVSVDALPGKSFTGSISRISGALAEDSRTMRAEIDMEARDGLLRPGMYASVRLELAGRGEALSLPATSIRHDRDRTYVWTIRDGIVVRTEIEILMDDGERVLVGSGIDPGTQVVIHPPIGLIEGQTVRVEEGGASR